MPLFHIKVCGITRAIDAISAGRAGADAIGLNFFPPSVRFVNVDLAREIIDAVQTWAKEVRTAPPHVWGVFANSTLDEILTIARRLPLDGIQFHGDERPRLLQELKRELTGSALNSTAMKPLLFVRAIRSLASSNSDSPTQLDVSQIVSHARDWVVAGVDGILLDAAPAGAFGGTGKQLDWASVSKLELDVPLILAGGLTPENVGEAVNRAQVLSVDVASGVESAPGVKDEQLIHRFVQNSRFRTDSP